MLERLYRSESTHAIYQAMSPEARVMFIKKLLFDDR